MRSPLPRLTFLGCLAVGSLGLGCGGESTQSTRADAGPPATFIDVQLVLNGAGCTESGCHGADQKGGLDLVSAPWDALVNAKAENCTGAERKRVVPGNPGKSYLLNKVRGTGLCSGSRMPRGCGNGTGPKCLSDEDIVVLESWIAASAALE